VTLPPFVSESVVREVGDGGVGFLGRCGIQAAYDREVPLVVPLPVADSRWSFRAGQRVGRRIGPLTLIRRGGTVTGWQHASLLSPAR
jgi:hypothetical protein